MALYPAAAILLFLLAAAVSLPPPAAAQPPWQVCGKNGGRYTSKSTYQANIQRLAATLPGNASSSPTLFATATAGAVPDVAYALALCRGDANATACGSCVATAFQDAQQLCAFDRDAAVYYDGCYLRFSNQNFLAATTSNDDEIILKNTQNVSSHVRAFDAAVGALLNATAGHAAANSSRRFATGVEGLDSSNPTIYGLTQCTPDMSPADCRSCLANIISMIPRYLTGAQGGRVFGVRCNFRYEVYPFFSGDPTLRLPAPAAPAPAPTPAPINVTPTATPSGGTRSKTGIVLAIALPIAAAVLAIIMI